MPEYRWLRQGVEPALPDRQLLEMTPELRRVFDAHVRRPFTGEQAATENDGASLLRVDLPRHAGQAAGEKRVVGIQKAQYFSTRLVQPEVNGVCLAAVRFRVDLKNVRELCRELPRDEKRVVGRAAVLDDDFQTRVILGDEALQGFPQKLPLVEGGRDDRDQRPGIHGNDS